MNANRNRSGSATRNEERHVTVKSASSKRAKSKSRSNSRTEGQSSKPRSLSKKSKSSYESISGAEDDNRKLKKQSSKRSRHSTRTSKTSDKSKKTTSSKTAKRSSKSPRDKESAQKVPDDIEDLRNQGLGTLSVTIFHKSYLRQLLVSGNNIRALPTSIKELVNLEYLDVSKNPLKIKDANDVNCFPLEMRFMKNLKRLNISECNLRYIPSAIWLIPTIEDLDISRNKIGLLVPEIGNLENLKILNLSQCDIATLPTEIGFCIELIEIILWGNQIEFLPESLKECTKLCQLKMSYRSFHSLLDSYMENLIRKGQIKSEHIPLVVFDLINLKALDLSSTKINNLPENNLQNLVELHLDNNFFEQLPETIFQVMHKTLKVLTIGHNFLQQIPHEAKLLENLEILNLNYNKLTIFPNDKINLLNLKELYLSNNQITELTNAIGMFKHLRKLCLDCNQLTQLPESLYDLVDLEYLDISYNQITRLSNKIIQLKSLKCAHSYIKLNKTGLWLIGNPLQLPPHNIWKTKNIEKIFNYLTTFYNRDINYIYYSKLIFIGDSGAGKSCIIDCMLDPLNIRNLLNSVPTFPTSSISANLHKKSDSTLAGGGALSHQNRNSTTQGGNVVSFISTPLDMTSNTGLVSHTAPKMTLHEQYTPVSKPDSALGTQFHITTGTDSAVLLRLLNLQLGPIDNLTRVARKLYLRTKDKCEFGILDLAGEQAYHNLYPLFLSTIDYVNQPVIFVLVYSHSEYTTILHDKLIGNWLKYIMTYTNNQVANNLIKIKLVGIKSDLINDAEDDYYDVHNHSLNETKKKNEIIDNCYQTINLYKKQLVKEKNRLEGLLKQQQSLDNPENEAFIMDSINLIKQQLDKEYEFINSDILVIKSDTMQADLNKLLNELQLETKKFNKRAPIQLRDQVKKHLLKHDRLNYKINIDRFYEKIEQNKVNLFTENDLMADELDEIVNNNERIIDYIATINDVFWLKNNHKYKDFLFHRTGFFLKCLQVLAAHDFDLKLDFNRNSIFKQIGLYQNESSFLNDFKLLKTYGIFNNKMLDALWFLNDFNNVDEENCLNLIQDLLIGYRAETNIIEPNQPKVKLILPSMCTNNFKRVEKEFPSKKSSKESSQHDKTSSTKQSNQNDKASNESKQQNELSSNELLNDDLPVDIIEIGKEENYFLKIDRIREYENIIKLIKGEKKEKAIWDLNKYTYENEDEEEEKAKNEQRRSALSAKLRETINIIPNRERQQKVTIEEIEEVAGEDDDDAVKATNAWNEITTTTVSNHEYLHSIADEFKYIKSYHDVEIDDTLFKYKFKYHIDLIFTLDISDINNLFYKLSILIQDYVHERLDSSDCVIARDVDNNFIKIELVRKFTALNNSVNTSASTISTQPSTVSTATVELNNKILIDVKTISMEHVENFKLVFNNLLNILFSFYPGITYLKQVSLANL